MKRRATLGPKVVRLGAGIAVVMSLPLACGGEDKGRMPPPPAPVLDGESEWCGADAEYELLSVIDFEGPPGRDAKQQVGTTLACNPALVAEGAGGSSGEGGSAGEGGGPNGAGGATPVCGFNFNYEKTDSSGNCHIDRLSERDEEVGLSTMSPWVGLEVPGGRCGIPTYAYHLEATNMGVCFNRTNGRRGWGSNFLIEFRGDSNQGGIEIDASSWDGIAFWARLGDGPSYETITVLVGDRDTSGGDYDAPSPDGRIKCETKDNSSVTMKPTVDAEKCDPFGVVVTLQPDWVFYVVPFEELKQKGFGQPAPNGELDPSRIWRMQISTSTGDWDFYVDDISFYRNPR